MSTATSKNIINGVIGASGRQPPQKKNELWRQVKKHKYFYYMLVLPVFFFIMFKYVPMMGIVLAFRRFTPGGSMFGTDWRGLEYFRMFMFQASYWKAFFNTLHISILSLIITFPINIIFALLLNEIRSSAFKKTVQTISYLPHFISIVVIVGLITQLLSPSTGIINSLLIQFGMLDKSVNFIARPEWFRPLFIGSGIWQNTGWNAIIYLAALAGVDPELYESAIIDGASRLKRTWYITLPSIAPTITILLILNVGGLLGVSFEKVLLMQNASNQDVSEVIQTYTYRVGLLGSNYSFGAAVGLFQGVIGLILLFITNMVANKVTGEGLW